MVSLPIAGIVPFTATDYPGHFSLVVFCQGCPLKCRYCHNTHLQLFQTKAPSPWSWDRVYALLSKRKGLLDGVVFSGGEPTAHDALLPAIQKAKSLGFKVGLHTAGFYPEKLKKLLPHTDWVGFDIKAPFEKYERVTQVPKSGEKAKESLEILLKSGLAYECRTTVHPALLSTEDVEEIGTTLSQMGVTHFALQEFRSVGCQDGQLTQTIPLFDPSIETKLAPLFQTFLVR